MIDSMRVEWARLRARRRFRQTRRLDTDERPQSARVLCVASGKGGTGKSVLSTNLACLRARAGERVLLLDFDTGLANDHLLLGLVPRHDLGHVMRGEVAAADALVEGPEGIQLLSGGVGRQVLAHPTRRELERLYNALTPLESQFDLIIVDHGAGLGYAAVAQFAAVSTLLLVTSPEVTALSDGYAVYKRATQVNPRIQVGLVVNRCSDAERAASAWDRFRSASRRFLGHAPELVGWVPDDAAIPHSVERRTPVSISDDSAPSSAALEEVSRWSAIDYARGPRHFFESARRALR